MHGSETWVLAKRSPQNVESAESRLPRFAKGFIRIVKISNHVIRSELGTCKLTE
jgi:hypothetical protein